MVNGKCTREIANLPSGEGDALIRGGRGAAARPLTVFWDRGGGSGWRGRILRGVPGFSDSRGCGRGAARAHAGYFAMASELVWAMSRHMEKGLAPRRVISRRARPPMGSRSALAANSSSSKAHMRGGDELREVADPGAEDVVAGGIDVDDAAAEARDPGAPVVRRPATATPSPGFRMVSEEPDRAIEERGIGIFSAADFFACHRGGRGGIQAGRARCICHGHGHTLRL